MPIEIAGVRYATRRPGDLDARLVAATGCASAEIEHLLVSGADRIAAAVLPFITGDVPSLLDLANAIAADPDAVTQVRALYATAPAVPALTKEA
ncbi:hypothetical protein [Sphingomonas sp. GM_Shp_2]|uniref:hypothetical protein n=1 Tax=Sphingomonas sp. GM_Shp_2 TaxID=2937380 RepID=UPI00226AB6AD|nr:hypothetical protein [Sphingomonas sp. GM_Shp_2]